MDLGQVPNQLVVGQVRESGRKKPKKLSSYLLTRLLNQSAGQTICELWFTSDVNVSRANILIGSFEVARGRHNGLFLFNKFLFLRFGM